MADSGLNLYEMIELDPSIVDEAPVRQRLEDQLKSANAVPGTASPAVRGRANKLKAGAKELREIAADSARRLQHARDCVTIINEKNRRAAPHIDLIARRGGYTETDITEIANRVSLPQDAVRELIVKAGVKPAKSAAPKVGPLPPRTDSSAVKAIEDDLRETGLPTLYAFIGRDNGAHFGRNSSRNSIDTRYKEIEAVLKKLIRGTPEHNRDNKLLGHVKTHLLDDKAREKYDNYCDIRPLEEQIKGLVETAGRDTKSVSADDYEFIVNKAQEIGTPLATAQSYVDTVLAEKKWGRQRSAGDGPHQTFADVRILRAGVGT